MSAPGPALRVISMLRARRAGATWDAVGRAHGVSGPRAYAVLRRWLFSDEWRMMQRDCVLARRAGHAVLKPTQPIG
jgi:hypothetical protein